MSLLNWSQALAAGMEQCGGKGFNLARLHSFAFAIPDGVVLSSEHYQRLIADESLQNLINKLQKIDIAELNLAATQAILNQIQEQIRAYQFATAWRTDLALELEDFLHTTQLIKQPLAVRSSASLEDGEKHSFAGIHQSFLNVRGSDAIIEAILNCYASLWSLAAVTYRRKMSIADQQLHCAVVIMQLVDCESSGVAFSCHPTQGRNPISLINANFGYGESLVNGLVEPDEYVLNSYSLQLEEIKVGSKTQLSQLSSQQGISLVASPDNLHRQVLTEEQIERLGEMLQRVYWCLSDGDYHVDIEWAFDGQDFYLLQARPVTRMTPSYCSALAGQQEYWSNGNFRDAAPMVQCLLQTSIFPQIIEAILKAPFSMIDYPIDDNLKLVKFYQGRAYLNVSALQWIYFDSTAYLPSVTNRTIGGHQPEIQLDPKNQHSLRLKLLRLWRGIKLLRIMQQYKKNAAQLFANVASFTQEILSIDLSRLSDTQLANKLLDCDRALSDYAPTFAILTSTSGAITLLYDLLEKYLPGQGTNIANTLLIGAGDITSANHGYQLQQLALLAKQDPEAKNLFANSKIESLNWQQLSAESAFKQAFQDFLHQYGHRAVYEGDLSRPRWREDPSYLLQIIANNLNHPVAIDYKQQQQAKAQQVWQQVKPKLPFFIRPIIRHMIGQAATGAAYRELAKSNFIRHIEPARAIFLEAGKRFQERHLLERQNDIFHCAQLELVALLKGNWRGEGLTTLITRRREKQHQWEQLPAVDLIKNEQVLQSAPQPSASGKTLQGMGVAAGFAHGKVRLITTPEQGIKLNPGDILVAPSTDPAWTPLFLNASAVVVETGGQLSHGAIVAREYGIPAVSNLPGLFQFLNDNDVINVDGNQGFIEKT